jgi:adenylate cyclase
MDVPKKVADLRRWSWIQRHGLFLVGVSPILANVIGSIFNVAYNTFHITPMLSPVQLERFESCVMWFNLLIYPIAVACFVIPLLRLRPAYRSLLAGESIDSGEMMELRRKVINLPWWFLVVAAIGWLSCIPAFPLVIMTAGEPLASGVVWHLLTSFLIASLIAVTQSFFAVEMTTQAALFPAFFQDHNPADVSGTVPLSIRARGILWAFSAVVCPVVSLVLLLISPNTASSTPLFGIAVAVVAIGFGLVTSWMLGKWVAVPVSQLQQAASEVAGGQLSARVSLLRSDDFGLLIERFNRMIDGLQHREKLQATFGRHVGREAAKQIMDQEGDSLGREQFVSVMFVDVRNFTQQSSSLSPNQVVEGLNQFFETAVEVIEHHGGMVNKYLGDGLMAIFGVGASVDGHECLAAQAALELLDRVAAASQKMQAVGWDKLVIGIGINSGTAVVGCIGSPRRQEYTAIGDTVNVASRVESLTKSLGHSILLTGNTHDAVQALPGVQLTKLPLQKIKGKAEPIEVFALRRVL